MRSRTVILIVKAVIKPEIHQFAPATVPTTFGELMEIHDSVSRKSQCKRKHHEHKVAIWDYRMGNHRLTYAYRLSQQSQYTIRHRLGNRSLFNPWVITPAYFLATYLPYRKWIQMNILYWFVGHLYTSCTICHYWWHISTKRGWCIDFGTWQNFFDFSDYIVRHDNLSVHVQRSYRPYERSRLQTELIDNWSMRNRPASHR